MNYYIQGNKDKAKEIEAAFKKIGYDVTGFDMCNDNILFFTYKLQNGCQVLSTTNANLYTADIIKTHPDYQELELPVEFKDGDIIGFNDLMHSDGSYTDWIGIYKQESENNHHLFHCVIPSCRSFRVGGVWRVFTAYPATKEQRELLFAKMKDAGYEWDADKKKLKKIKPHYDISNFHAGMPVLVRDNKGEEWRHTAFSHITSRFDENKFAAGCTYWCQCIPFNDDTKHLLGTTYMPDEMYINW